MKCFRCRKDAEVASVTPLGGVVLCEGCVEVILTKAVNETPLFFGRCFRDAFRLCTPECTHLELGPTVDRDGEPRVESATCNASATAFDRQTPDGGLAQNFYPVYLRRRSTDEYLAALLLTTRSEELQTIIEGDIQEGGDDGGGAQEPGDYREGDM